MSFDRRQFLAASGALAALPCLPGLTLAAEDPPANWRGAIADNPEKKTRGSQILGNAGVLLIRSAGHLKWVHEGLYEAGYPVPKGGPPFSVDFAKQAIAVVVHHGDEGNQFDVRPLAISENRTKLDVVMSYIIYKNRGRVVNKFQFVAIAIPRAATTEVSISTFHPHNGGPYPTIDKAKKEWSHEFTAERGDLVDGLHARLRAEKPAIASGEDIRCQFVLDFHSPMSEAGQFSQAPAQAYVWDGKYSNGYRNHAFLVELPDGSSKIYRPAEIGDWSKNAPHPVELSAGKSYVLPNWREGENFKSLRDLGLETKQPGKYTITGLYAQNSNEFQPLVRGRAATMWGGRIATAPVTVEVK